MTEFNLEEFFIIPPPEEDPSDVGILKAFFRKRRIIYAKIGEALGCTSQRVNSWFNKQYNLTTEWKAKFESLMHAFIEWEEAHGYMFNSEEHIAAYKSKPGPPTLKPVIGNLPRYKYVPLHDCPYAKDGLRFGFDYDEYDVCDDCYVKIVCMNYKKIRIRKPK